MNYEQHQFVYEMAEKISKDPSWLEAVILAATEGAKAVERKSAEAVSYVPVLITRAEEASGKKLIKALRKGMNPRGFIALGLLRDYYPGWKELPTRKEIEKEISPSP